MDNQSFTNIQIEQPRPGVFVVWFDVVDHSMNVFTSHVIRELEDFVQQFDVKAARGLIFASRKPTGFFAGADVHEIRRLQPEDSAEVLLRGQMLFDRIEQLACPTVAAIHGPCLGGGLEFALACDHRIACDDPSTKLGLPEIQLGLIPGWGGTQRLPQLIGLRHALPMILKGKPLVASKAREVGLIDELLPADRWPQDLIPVAIQQFDRQMARPRRWPAILMNRWPLKSTILRTADRTIRTREEHYPALRSALKAVAAGLDANCDGFAEERRQFEHLLGTPTCRNLLNLFLWREQARSLPTHSTSQTDKEAPPPVPIRTVGVVGAGAMGAGIAQLLLTKGLQVVVRELTPELAEAGRSRIVNLLSKAADRGRLSSTEYEDCVFRLHVMTDLKQLADCDLVIEAVVEELGVKQRLFEELDQILPPTAVLVSNTSALSIQDIAASVRFPGRIAGLHFFNPVHRMELVEVVRAQQTLPGVVHSLLQLTRRLGKTPVVTSDSPGFLVNRVLFPYLAEAMRLVSEGHDLQNVDREAKRFGLPMGPLELLDHVGLDVALHVTDRLQAVLPDSQHGRRLLQRMVDCGWLGSKSGVGFYRHETDGKLSVNEALASIFTERDIQSEDRPGESCCGGSQANVGRFVDDGLTELQRRLVYSMINEVGFCLQESVVDESWQADLAMVLGTGFAPFRGGPISFARSLRPSTLLNNFSVLAARHGDRFKPSAWLVGHVRLSNLNGPELQRHSAGSV